MIQSTSSQRKDLYRLFGYCKETEAMHIIAITNGKGKTAKDITMAQANQLKNKLTTHWAIFHKENKQHKYILSLLNQLQWTKEHPTNGTIADMSRLSSFLKSKKSPVPKPLQDMCAKETSKLITCLESMIKKLYK